MESTANDLPPENLDERHAVLVEAWRNSPAFSVKIDTYFQVYANLFGHLRGTNCTFIECGVLGGGSLFMWREWLGKEARIIGVDLNPGATKWASHGFEIFIGDQGDPIFWDNLFKQVGPFDALLDDGGHQSFQQVVTLNAAVLAAENDCVIAIEDTGTSFFKDFKTHGKYSFLSYAKSCTDLLLKPYLSMVPGRTRKLKIAPELNIFHKIHKIEFYGGVVAFHVNQNQAVTAKLMSNMAPEKIPDFRYGGVKSARILWPTLFKHKVVKLRGGATILRRLKVDVLAKKLLRR